MGSVKKYHWNLANICAAFIILVLLCISFELPAHAANKSFGDSYITIDILYSDVLVRGKNFMISSLISNNSNYQLDNITLVYIAQDNIFRALDNNTFFEKRLAGSGSVGHSIRFSVQSNATAGVYYMNLMLSYVKNGSEGVIQESLAITVQEKARLILSLDTPQSIFPGDTFHIQIEIRNVATIAKNINVDVMPPPDLIFRGQTQHNISELATDKSFKTFVELQSPENISISRTVPFQVKISYTDEDGEMVQDSQTELILLRQRELLEIGGQNGIWIGPLPISYNIGVGTIIGSIASIFPIRKWILPWIREVRRLKKRA